MFASVLELMTNFGDYAFLVLQNLNRRIVSIDSEPEWNANCKHQTACNQQNNQSE